jgi:hypothetical protein
MAFYPLPFGHVELRIDARDPKALARHCAAAELAAQLASRKEARR